MNRLRILLLVLVAACAVDPLGTVDGELLVAGSGTTSFEGRDGWQVELSVAELTFGPLYLCAGTSSGDLCETARGEFLDVVTIDALNATPVSAGPFYGLSGDVRSAMWSYGTTWELHKARPEAIVDAPSLRVAGVARRAGEEVHFQSELTLEPTLPGQVLVRASQLFEHPLEDGDRLLVQGDAEAWFAGVNFSALVGQPSSPEAPIGFTPDDQAWRSLSNALRTRARPSLQFQPPTR